MVDETLELFVGYSQSGKLVREEVRVTPLGGLLYKIEQSPGLVLGIASGDVIELRGDGTSKFEIQKRGGNICLQIFFPEITNAQQQIFEHELRQIGGWLDGKSSKELVFSVPMTVGFQLIEKTLAVLVNKYPECEWYYGNVYDPQDGVTPLNWWSKSSEPGTQ